MLNVKTINAFISRLFYSDISLHTEESYKKVLYKKTGRTGQKQKHFFHVFHIILYSLNTCQCVKFNGRIVVVRF